MNFTLLLQAERSAASRLGAIFSTYFAGRVMIVDNGDFILLVMALQW